MKLEACADYVVIQPITEEKKGAIFIPETAQKKYSGAYGIVTSVGPEYVPAPDEELSPGMKVMYRKDEGTPIETFDGKFLCLKPEWLLAIMEG